MVDNLDAEVARARLKAFLDAVIDQKGPKAVARDLTSLGWPYPEGTVRSWRGTAKTAKNPPPDVVFGLSALYQVSLDQYALGEALERTVIDRLEEVERHVNRLAGRLHAWEIEIASAEGREPPEDVDDGALNLESARFRKRVEELERLVGELRQQQA